MGSGEHGYSKELAQFESQTPDWPATGDLEVHDLIASYGNTNDDPEVLKGLTFSVRSGERIGIGEFDISIYLYLQRSELSSIIYSWSYREREGMSFRLTEIFTRSTPPQSTLTLALLRCIFTNLSPRLNSRFVKTGEVLYSGRSIGSLDLPVLRKNITIIPQNVSSVVACTTYKC